MSVKIQPTGDHALTVTFGDAIDESINKQVLSFFHFLLFPKFWATKAGQINCRKDHEGSELDGYLPFQYSVEQ